MTDKKPIAMEGFFDRCRDMAGDTSFNPEPTDTPKEKKNTSESKLERIKAILEE